MRRVDVSRELVDAAERSKQFGRLQSAFPIPGSALHSRNAILLGTVTRVYFLPAA